MGFPKRLLGDGETLVLHLRPHVKRLFGPVVLLLVVAPGATFVAGLVPDSAAQGWIRGAVALAAVLVLLRWTVRPFLVWWNTLYVITSRRLVTRQGVLTRSGRDMPLTRLNDVSFSHTLLQRMLGCGTLVVESAGERGQLALTDVPKVEQVQRILYRLSDAAREGGGGRSWAAADALADLDGGDLADDDADLDDGDLADADLADDDADGEGADRTADRTADPAGDQDVGPPGERRARSPWGRRR